MDHEPCDHLLARRTCTWRLLPDEVQQLSSKRKLHWKLKGMSAVLGISRASSACLDGFAPAMRRYLVTLASQNAVEDDRTVASAGLARQQKEGKKMKGKKRNGKGRKEERSRYQIPGFRLQLRTTQSEPSLCDAEALNGRPFSAVLHL